MPILERKVLDVISCKHFGAESSNALIQLRCRARPPPRLGWLVVQGALGQYGQHRAREIRERQNPDRSTAPRSLLEYGNISTPERTQGRRKACWQQRRQPQQQDTARLAQTRPNRMARNTTKRPRRAPAQQPPKHRQSVKTAIGRERLKLGEPHGQEESQVPYWLLAFFAGAARQCRRAPLAKRRAVA